MVPVRIKFSKTGSLKFISHLDLMRTMKSAMIRAKIPVLYSEGYNPRPKMVFTMPLSIGTESFCEVLDIKITEPMDFELIKERLTNSLPNELRIRNVYTPINKISDIGYAQYRITFDEEIDIEKITHPLVKNYSYLDRNLFVLLSADSNNYLNPNNLAKELTASGYDILKLCNFLKDGETAFI